VPRDLIVLVVVPDISCRSVWNVFHDYYAVLRPLLGLFIQFPHLLHTHLGPTYAAAPARWPVATQFHLRDNLTFPVDGQMRLLILRRDVLYRRGDL